MGNNGTKEECCATGTLDTFVRRAELRDGGFSRAHER
jgi:hypothetical protein